jgi:transketolase
MLTEEVEHWKNRIKVKEGGIRLVITRQQLKKPAQQDSNTAKTLNKKLKNTQKRRNTPADRCADAVNP